MNLSSAFSLIPFFMWLVDICPLIKYTLHTLSSFPRVFCFDRCRRVLLCTMRRSVSGIIEMADTSRAFSCCSFGVEEGLRGWIRKAVLLIGFLGLLTCGCSASFILPLFLSGHFTLVKKTVVIECLPSTAFDVCTFCRGPEASLLMEMIAKDLTQQSSAVYCF